MKRKICQMRLNRIFLADGAEKAYTVFCKLFCPFPNQTGETAFFYDGGGKQMKKTIPQELAYVIGVVTLAMGAALMARADFGMSMVVGPAYVTYLKLSRTLTWFTFGMAAYTIQALLLVVLSVVMKKFRFSYLFSFATAFFYGQTLDLFMLLTGSLAGRGMAVRAALYVGGMLLCALGVANMFKTYIAPEVYELFVKEVAAKYHKDIGRTKTVYDCASCLAAVILSFVFFGFGRFEGVSLGTVFCALVNGSIIGLFSRLLDKMFVFKRMIGGKI